MFDAVLFDLDGTLIDSEGAHKSTETQIFREYGASLEVSDLAEFTGMPLTPFLAAAQVKFGFEITIEQFILRSKELLGAEVGRAIQPYPDTVAVLDSVGVRMALVTSSTSWYVEAVRAAFPQVFDRFTIQVIGDDVVLGKPHPEPYLKAVELLGVSAHRCLVIEDSHNGVQSGLDAGCHVWQVDHFQNSHPEAHRSGRTLSELFS